MDEKTRYSRVIPNSQSFESLDNIVVHHKIQPEEITLDYLLTGFYNTRKRGWDLGFDKNNMQEVPPPFHFTSVSNIITFLEVQQNFDIDDFAELMKATMANGFNLKQKTEMERKKIYKRIDTERDYQDLRWTPRRAANGVADEDKSPAEWLNYMEYHLGEAKREDYMLNTEEVLAHVRKIAALAVRCMELHGCPKRVIPEELLNED